MKRRIFFSLLLLTASLLFIAGKLFWIQVLTPRKYSSHQVDLVKNSVLQRQRGLVLDSGRGDFVDRHMLPLTGQTVQGALIFPVRSGFDGSERQNREMARILHISDEEWRAYRTALKEPAWWSSSPDGTPKPLTADQVARIEELQLPNVKIANYKIRYPDGEPAKQLIGFISQNPERVAGVFKEQLDKGWLQITSEIGAAGLEKTFEYWLQGNGATTISYFTDAGKRPLQGLNARLVTPDTAYYPLKIVTTLDKRVQQNIETFMKQMNITKGAAVVLDASNADVIAMASRPSYDPNHVDPEQGNWGNLALKAAAPGSIFKTVVAAAALDEGAAKPQETFDCEGALGKYGFTCWKKEGHGLITLEEAFAESCNITFAKVMERLTPKQLEAYARKMGLLSQVGWSGKAEGKELSQFDAEDAGQLFAKGTPSSDEGVLVQTAIGQRDVRMTPLQAANLVVTLLHKGEVLEPRVVKEIRMRNERVLETFPERSFVSPGDGISPQTAALLLRWMEEVVDHGTGTVLKHAEWSTAGKSGTAQVNNGPNPTVNQWFIGYAPVERPQYAIAVAVEDVPASEENRAVPLFKSIVNLLSGLAER